MNEQHGDLRMRHADAPTPEATKRYAGTRRATTSSASPAKDGALDVGVGLQSPRAARPQVDVEPIFESRDGAHVRPRSPSENPGQCDVSQLAPISNLAQRPITDLRREREREPPRDFPSRVRRRRVRPGGRQRVWSRSLRPSHRASLDAHHRVDHEAPEASLRRARHPPCA